MKGIAAWCALPTLAFALETKPWLDTPWEFEFTPAFTYSAYPRVQGARPARHSGEEVRLWSYDLSLVPLEGWEVDLEAEFSGTSKMGMGYRSSALQIRWQLLDDITGDLVSLTLLGSFRGVSGRELHDSATPYAAKYNYEGGASLGKEWGGSTGWQWRTFGYLGAGIANEGAYWLRPIASFEGAFGGGNRLALLGMGIFGFGHKERVELEHFDGYGKYRYQAVDVGVRYGYEFPIWGEAAVEVGYRVYARSYPERVGWVTVSYRLPFSVL